MPVFTSQIRFSSEEASFSSTIETTAPEALRRMRPYPVGSESSTVSNTKLPSAPASAMVISVFGDNNGTSPKQTSVMGSSGLIAASACISACPVPSCSCCNAKTISVRPS